MEVGNDTIRSHGYWAIRIKWNNALANIIITPAPPFFFLVKLSFIQFLIPNYEFHLFYLNPWSLWHFYCFYSSQISIFLDSPFNSIVLSKTLFNNISTIKINLSFSD